MGSLHEGNNKSIDESLGGLVWVRRRNGRWWPGRILRPEELPDTIPSSKSGTAIKLLGRDDASVDWYNVEKPTDVKAFRCGEYAECIEKAEVTATSSSKRIVKCKEDAIKLALEIERACLGKDHPVSNSEMTNQGQEIEDLPRSFCQLEEETNNMGENGSNSETESDLAQGLSLSSVSSEDPAYTGTYVQTVERTSNDSEDDGTEVVKHMKGLDNLGAPVIASSRRKRFQVAHVREFLKRKHRRRTVTKILESKIMVTVPVVYEKLAHPTKSLPRRASSWKVSQVGSDVPKAIFSLKEYDGSPDDGLYDVPMITEEQHCADFLPSVYRTSEGAHVCGGTKYNEHNQVETVSLGKYGSISSGIAEVNNIIQGVDIGISKWQLKGKRSRHTNKNRKKKRKFIDVCDEFDSYAEGAECSIDHNTFSGSQPTGNCTHPLKSRAVSEIKIDEDIRWNRNTYSKVPHGSQVSTELLSQQRLLPHRESRCSMNSKYQDFLIGHHSAESTLFDVNLVVKANYRPQHVPYVSLTSKINGPSIIGHLLTVEVLDDGFCDNLISDPLLCGSSYELDGELGETSTALGGIKLDLETRSNSVRQILLKHTLENVTPSKLRKCGLLSKKIRKLSSLTGAGGEHEEKKLIVEKLRGPSLAFVPLTIVFSRLNEALNSP
ncbi:hypothetical protein LIER_06517 [Lithospermum erythrorhizon]|uniref:PWWP domain-containing protein n=1 Tax=Lithospermum erythrorhizon TaxID=34254 RepID=A0AAV3P7C4_LITER